MASFDPYQVLDVPEDADGATIRRAYQKLARRLHPDLRPGDRDAEKRFQEVARAYRLLSNRELRRRYDEGRLDAERRLEELRGARVTRITRRTGRHFRYESFLEVHAEWSESGEWAGEGEGEELRGEDLSAEITLEFAEAVRGVTTSFSVQRERECEECSGAGESLSGEPCEACAGRGVVVDLDRIRVRIPRGVDDGTRLRLPGKGNPPAGTEGGESAGREPGNLYLTVRVRPHPYFRRSGLDVHGDLPVSFAEAALGAEVEVPTLDGPVRVRLPAGTSGGQRFRLRGRGVRRPDGRAGDHYYTVRIVVPDTLDDETRRLVENLPRQEPRAGLPKGPV
ncbi:MAG: DnaJ C-terminal domain-containing protein [bacterium]